MNKSKIKSFAIWAREKLLSDIHDKVKLLGILDTEILLPLPQSTSDLLFFDIGTTNYVEVSGKQIKQRENLIRAIKEKQNDSLNYTNALNYIIEEVAYTWFNRLIAIRFMEVNDYLPSGLRVLSSTNSRKLEPDFVTTPFETDLDFTPYEKDKVIQYKDENKLDELFRFLFIKQCNKLSEILPELFEKTDDYTELLLTISFIDTDGIVYHLVHDIEEDDFNIEKEGQVEIIGWLYQYYISTKHEEVVDPLHGKVIEKEDIPAATQLFTTDWVVRYMVDNSLGRYWIERNQNSRLSEKLDYYIPKVEENNNIYNKISPTDLTFFDPCMGSGHILVYAFDVLMDIYRECGYTDKDASISIIENNLYGLDIDKRAYQLTYFALMMKARSYNRNIFRKQINNNISFIEESNNVIEIIESNKSIIPQDLYAMVYSLFELFKHAKEIGSLQLVEKINSNDLFSWLSTLDNNNSLDLFTSDILNSVKTVILQLIKQAEILSDKYSVVCTNPPYLNKYSDNLKKYVLNNYKDYKGDLFSVFIYRNFNFCKEGGYSAFMTPNSWMFLKSYVKLREYILNNKSISTFVKIANGAFYEEATVNVCSFVLKNIANEKNGIYINLSDIKGNMEYQKKGFLNVLNNNIKNGMVEYNQDIFKLIPDSTIAFWGTKNQLAIFDKSTVLNEIANPKQGLITGDVNRFVRKWYETSYNDISFDSTNLNINLEKKWFPYNNGGSFRKWYGNNEDIVNWYNNGIEVKSFVDENGKQRSRPQNQQFYFREGGTWTAISSSYFSVRYFPTGFLFSNAGMAIYADTKDLLYIIGFLNSKLSKKYLDLFNDGLNFNQGDIARLPIFINDKETIISHVKKCIEIAFDDYNDSELSWDFKRNPLISNNTNIEIAYENYKKKCDQRFNLIKENEEKINSLFLTNYKLQDELTCQVDDNEVTIYRIFDTKQDIPITLRKNKYILTKQDVVKDLISYSVGCMFGRYSLDKEGITYAGGDFQLENINTFIPDVDNCIPITDEDYFQDDIVGLFISFIQTVYGKQNLEENLSFIANSLYDNCSNYRIAIRKYFLNDFIQDHITKYQQKPIYWLFNSGKQNGFKALVYMHRWDENTVGNVRVDYLHKIQKVYEREIERMSEIIDSSADNKEIITATKRKEKIQKQLKETKDYDSLISHIALSRIGINLDDGVKYNYNKVQTSSDGKKYPILYQFK